MSDTTSTSANPYRDLEDEDLLAQCRVETYRSSGPGGQHRNKVETAVRLTHEPTGLQAQASDSRSQARNKDVALERLRERLQEHFHEDAPRLPTRKSRMIRLREREEQRKMREKRRLRQQPPTDE